MTAEITQKSTTNIKTIALPVQHGGWGFWLEPTLTGLLLAFSLPGFCLGIAGLMLLLLHQPLRIYLKDIRKGKRYARTKIAERFILLYGAILFAAAVFILMNANDGRFIFVIVLALLPALVQLWYEMQNKGRALLPELAGAVMFGALAPAIVLRYDAHTPMIMMLALWAALAVRSVPSIFYVRARLRLENGKPVKILPVFGVHALGFCALLFLIQHQALPHSTLLAHALLTVRAIYGLSSFRHPAPAKIIGFQEIAMGILYTLILVMGY